MKNNICEATLNYDLCIGCGMCASLCPVNAIEMKKNDELFSAPVLNENKCVNCGVCAEFCPNSKNALISMNKAVAEEENYHIFGLHSAKGFLLRSSEDGVEKSASGGVATALAKKMLENGMIDAVVNAKSVVAKNTDIHFIGSISRSADDLEKSRGSFYAPISFENALNEIKNDETIKSILVIGTPCVARGFKKMLLSRKQYGIEKCYTFSLACSHNVNGMLSAYLADTFGIDREKEWSVNFRDKKNALNATNFNTAFTDENGDTLARENRYKSQFTPMWRSFAFSMNCCNSCSDFWGFDADVSVKDAWGKWSKDKDAKSIVIFRNSELERMMNDMPFYKTELDENEILTCQKETVTYKQGAAKKRMKYDNPKKWDKIDFDHKLHAKIRDFSKNEYLQMLENGYSNDILSKVKTAEKLENNKPSVLIKRIKKKLMH